MKKEKKRKEKKREPWCEIFLLLQHFLQTNKQKANF